MDKAKGNANRKLADLFLGRANTFPVGGDIGRQQDIAFSYLFFSDVRTNVSNREKYAFARDLVTFADQTGFEAVYFPERHFGTFGSIYANNATMAAYFAPITKHVRLRSAAVTASLHHPADIVESWAMVDNLSDGRVDLGFGSGWEKKDFILSPDTYDNRVQIRDERIPIIQDLWRGNEVVFPGPGGTQIPICIQPRPIQPELNVWYVTTSRRGFEYAGSKGYNVFTMLSGIDLNELGKHIGAYRAARTDAGLNPESGTVSLMMHTLVHPDTEWVEHAVSAPFRDYIRTSLAPHLRAMGKSPTEEEAERIVDYSFTRYFKTGGLFGPFADCCKQVDKAISVGVNEIAFLQDFGVEYSDVISSLGYLEQLVDFYRLHANKRAEAIS